MRGLLFPINSYLPPNWCHRRCLQLDTVPCSWYGCFLILGFADLRDTLIRLHSQECHSSAIKETVPEPPGVVGISCKHKPPDGFLWKCATQWYTPKWPSYPSGENNDQPSNSEIPQKKDKPRASQCDSYQVGQQIWASHVSGEQERGIYHSPDLFLTRRILPVVAKDIRLWVRQRTMSKWDLGDPGHRHHLPLFSPRSLWVPPWTPRQKIGEDED